MGSALAIKMAQQKEGKLMKRLGLLVLAPALLVSITPMSPAGADTYANLDQVAAAFSPDPTSGMHVLVDQFATPKLPKASALNDQVLGADRKLLPQFNPDGARGIYIANVGKTKTGFTPELLEQAMERRYGAFSGVILILSDQYHSRAWNASPALLDSSDSVVNEMAAQHHGDIYAGTSAMVDAWSKVTPDHPYAAPSHDINIPAAVWWWILGIIGFIALAIVTIVGFVKWGARRASRRMERDRLAQELIYRRNDMNDISNAMTTGDAETQTKLSAASIKAGDYLTNARESFEAGRYPEARAHLRNFDRAVAEADKTVLHRMPAVDDVPKEERKKAMVNTIDPATKEKVRISNEDYCRTRRGEYRYYWPGGKHRGVYFRKGYYRAPVSSGNWSPADVILWDTVLRDSTASNPPTHHSGSSYGTGASYGGGSSHGTHHSSSSSSTGTSAPFSGGTSAPFSGGGFTGSSGGTSAGF